MMPSPAKLTILPPYSKILSTSGSKTPCIKLASTSAPCCPCCISVSVMDGKTGEIEKHSYAGNSPLKTSRPIIFNNEFRDNAMHRKIVHV